LNWHQAHRLFGLPLFLIDFFKATDGYDPWPMTHTDPKIYVVDDHESARTGLGRLLRSVGFRVMTFVSAQDFLDYGQVGNGELLVLDVRMPGISGLELQKRLLARGSKIPIIFLTAFEDLQARNAALKAGAIAFLQKPVDEETLLEAIKRALPRQATRIWNENS
jgi:FixJ family two-component response regulator